MLFNKILVLLLTLMFLTNCDQKPSGIRTESDLVQEGDFSAEVISPTNMTSNYPMLTYNSIKQPIIFKLSLNGRDNEAGFGVDHHLMVPEGIAEFYAPTLKFGVYAPLTPGAVQNLIQPANVHFRVDLRPILESFTDVGFYVTATNDTIFSDNFQGLYLAGGAVPLAWIWDNPAAMDPLRFEDADQDSIYEIKIGRASCRERV